MNYTEEEIDRYIKILKSVDESLSPSPQSNTVTCKNCHCSDFFIQSGYYYCSNRFLTLGHVLGYYDKSEYEDFTFEKYPFIKESITIRTRFVK